MALDEKQRETLRTKTVEYLLCMRAQHLAAGGSPLKHWETIPNRVLSAARRSATVEEWGTAVAKGLQVTAPSSSTSSAFLDLANTVRDLGAAAEWFALLESEIGFLMAMTRKIAEERRGARETEAT